MHFPWLSQTAESRLGRTKFLSWMQQISNNLPPKKQFRKDGYFRSKQHPRQFINWSSAFNLGSSSKCNQRNCVSIMSAENFSCTSFQWWSLWRRTTTRQCHYFRQNWLLDTLHVTRSPLISTTQNVGQNQGENLQYNIIWKDDDYIKLRWSKSFLGTLSKTF